MRKQEYDHLCDVLEKVVEENVSLENKFNDCIAKFLSALSDSETRIARVNESTTQLARSVAKLSESLVDIEKKYSANIDKLIADRDVTRKINLELFELIKTTRPIINNSTQNL